MTDTCFLKAAVTLWTGTEVRDGEKSRCIGMETQVSGWTGQPQGTSSHPLSLGRGGELTCQSSSNPFISLEVSWELSLFILKIMRALNISHILVWSKKFYFTGCRTESLFKKHNILSIHSCHNLHCKGLSMMA